MNERPKKRLVNKRQYAAVMGERYSLTVFAWLQMGCGMAGVVSLIVFLRMSYVMYRSSGLSEVGQEGTLVVSIAISLVSLTMIGSSITLFKKARRIEPVALLTIHNAHLLPSEETLVRGSALPASDQQTELLRAVPQGSETPPEELLRATTNRGPEGAVDHE